MLNLLKKALPCVLLLGVGCGGGGRALGGSDDAAVEMGGDSGGQIIEKSSGDREMVLVPAGVFAMGWSKGQVGEQPVHVVYLDSFYIDKYEVSVGQYRACVAEGHCAEPLEAPNCHGGDFAGETHPINCMNWFDARAYCAWAGLRLPSEAEWEKAARGSDGRIYPWGDQLRGDEANYRIGSGTATEPVGNRPDGISPYGAHDMAGNVWEWVEDWYAEDYYARSPRDNPPGPDNGQLRVLRGGSWWFEADSLPAAHRVAYNPVLTDIDIGFRCASDH